MAEKRERRSREEREAALLEDVREMLRERGKELDARTLEALTGMSGEGRVVEGGPPTMVVIWRMLRIPALILLAALMILLLYVVFNYGQPQPAVKPATTHGGPATTRRR